MSDTLVIHVNRSGPHSIEVPRRFETGGDFTIEIRNEGEPVHVHLNLDDDLAPVVSTEPGNHYVARASTYPIPARTNDGRRPVRGRLSVSTGYGSETRYVDVLIDDVETEREVAVDERLGKPRPRQEEPSPLEGIAADFGVAAVVVLAVIALVISAVVLALVTDGVVVLGVLAVIGGIGVAAYLLMGR